MNWILLGGVLLLVLWKGRLAGADLSEGDRVLKSIPAPAALALFRETTGAVLLDVRTPAEFAGGALAGARNVDALAPDFERRLEALDRAAPWFIYCRSGGRSRSALAVMKRLGFQRVHDVMGGLPACLEAGFPAAR